LPVEEIRSTVETSWIVIEKEVKDLLGTTKSDIDTLNPAASYLLPYTVLSYLVVSLPCTFLVIITSARHTIRLRRLAGILQGGAAPPTLLSIHS
jgi:hypothetical protein